MADATRTIDPNVTRDGIKVGVGQRWRDLDKRMSGRVVTVIAVEPGFAHVKGDGRRTRLSISRMHRHHNGWELVL